MKTWQKIVLGIVSFLFSCWIFEIITKRIVPDGPPVEKIIGNLYRDQSFADSLGKFSNMKAEFIGEQSIDTAPFSMTIVGEIRVLIVSGVAIKAPQSEEWQFVDLKREHMGITKNGPLDVD